jgi:hypothetical protein
LGGRLDLVRRTQASYKRRYLVAGKGIAMNTQKHASRKERERAARFQYEERPFVKTEYVKNAHDKHAQRERFENRRRANADARFREMQDRKLAAAQASERSRAKRRPSPQEEQALSNLKVQRVKDIARDLAIAEEKARVKS